VNTDFDLMTREYCSMAVKDAMEQGITAAEAFGAHGRYITIETQMSEVDFAREETKQGFGFRVADKDALGFASTNDVDRLSELVKKAIAGSRARTGAGDFAGFAGVENMPDVKGTWDPGVAKLGLDKCIDSVEAILEGAESVEGVRVVSSTFSCYDYVQFLCNSEGLETEWGGTMVMVLCECAAGGDEAVTALEFELSRCLDIDFRPVGERAARLAVESAGGKHGPSGVMDVVLSPMAFEEIFEYVLKNALDGDGVYRGRCAWVDMVGKKVAPDWLTVLDDGLIPGGMGTAPCDDEGTPSRCNVLVRDGLLQGFLHSRESAYRLSTESTGNAVREDYHQVPKVEIRNLRLECRREPPLEGCERGLLVHGLVGAHTINPHSGDFSLQTTNAFIVRRGEVERPVNGVMLSGNVFDALKNIVAISEEEKCMGNVIAPWVRVEGLNVVGRG